MQLRPYQQDLYTKTLNQFRSGKRRVLVVSPCGSGKTITMAAMAAASQQKGKNVWIILPRQEILEQTIETFQRCDIPLNTIYVGMAITTANHVSDLPTPDLIIFDECHISVASTYWKIVNAAPKAFIVGLTASPCRTDNKPLSSLYETLVEGVTVRWLIDNKYLAPYEYYSVNVADLGDTDDQNADAVLMTATVYGNVIQSWKKFADGVSTVVYCASVKHSKETAEKFCEAGIKAVHFDGETPYAERKSIVDRFRSGEIAVLCNCDLISMGFDMPDIGCVLMLRPTQSLSLYIQQSGRALRYKPQKTAIIIDAVANYARFQLPDMPYEWSLDKPVNLPKRMNQNGDFKIRTCKECFMVFPTAPVCPFCGAAYALEPKEIKAHEEIQLERITEEKKRELERLRKKQKREVGMCTTFRELLNIEKERGYKTGWAFRMAKMKGIKIER